MSNSLPASRRWPRVALLASAGVALIFALIGAALKVGLWAPITVPGLGVVHGVVAILGFLTIAIALERAVAAATDGGSWAFAAPLAAAVGALGVIGLTSITHFFPGLIPAHLARLLFTGAGAALICAQLLLVATYAYLWRRRHDIAVAIQALGAVCAAAGACLWLAATPLPILVPFLLAFPVLTVLGERLELARVGAVLGPRRSLVVAEVGQLLAASLYCLALFLTLSLPVAGTLSMGLALAVLGLLALGRDIARKTVFARGLPQFAAVGILAAYFWLFVAAAIWILVGPLTSGLWFEAVIHALTLGFTMSMIFAHAPIIIPAVTGLRLPFHPVLWVPLVVLHGGLVVRFAIGAAHSRGWAWAWGGSLNICAILVFAACVIVLVRRGTRARGVAQDA